MYEALLAEGMQDERPALGQKIDPRYWGRLRRAGNPISQLHIDLERLNGDPPFADGTVSMLIWLSNLARLAGLTVAGELAVRMHAQLLSGLTDQPPATEMAILRESEEAIVLSDERLPVDFLSRGTAASKRIGLMKVPCFKDGKPLPDAGAKPRSGKGTAWLITPDRVMTSRHVIVARSWRTPGISESDFLAEAEATTVRFDYDAEQSEGVEAGVAALEAFDANLDFAVLRLEGLADRGQLELNRQRIDTARKDEEGKPVRVPVNIIQHPKGEAKLVALRSNLVTHSGPKDLRYFSDTEKRASGSPVCNDHWQVVALHRATRGHLEAVENFQGKKVAVSNVGTQIDAILDHLERKEPKLWAELQPKLRLAD